MTTPAQPQKRVRINVETSVKGVKTWDATVEIVDSIKTGVDLVALTLSESDRLVAELERRYASGDG